MFLYKHLDLFVSWVVPPSSNIQLKGKGIAVSPTKPLILWSLLLGGGQPSAKKNKHHRKTGRGDKAIFFYLRFRNSDPVYEAWGEAVFLLKSKRILNVYWWKSMAGRFYPCSWWKGKSAFGSIYLTILTVWHHLRFGVTNQRRFLVKSMISCLFNMSGKRYWVFESFRNNHVSWEMRIPINFECCAERCVMIWQKKILLDTVDGRNPAPPGMYTSLLIMG